MCELTEMSVIFFIGIHLLLVNGAPEESVEPNDVHNDFFGKLHYHNEPLYRCPKPGINGIPYAMPQKPDCSPPDLEDEETTNVTVQTYWADFKIHPIQAVECFEHTITHHVHETMWGHEIRTNDQEFYTLPYLLSDCIDLRQNQRTKRNEALEFIASGLYGTKFNSLPETRWIKTRTQTNVNTFLYHVDVTVNIHDGTISTVGPVLTESCKWEKGFCPTTKGILVWDKSEHRGCRLKLGRKSSCLKTGKTLTCPDLMITVANIQVSKVCGVSLGATGTGGFFSSEKKGEISEEVDGTEQVMRLLAPMIPKERRRRETVDHNGIIIDPGMATYVEYPLHGQFIISKVLQGDKTQYWNVHQTICRNNAMLIDHCHHQAATGDATGMVQTLTGDRSLRATMHGDLVNVYACEIIHDYQFSVRSKVENCTLEYPVRVMGDDKVVREMWLKPLSHEVVETPTATDCPPNPFYFQVGNDVVVLDAKKYMNDVDTLPNPGRSINPEEYVEITFNPGSLYTMDELTGRSFQEMQLQKLNAATQWGSAMVKLRSGQRVSDSEAVDINAVGRYWGGDFIMVGYTVLGLLCFICVALALFLCHSKWQWVSRVFEGVGAFFRVLGGWMERCFGKRNNNQGGGEPAGIPLLNRMEPVGIPLLNRMEPVGIPLLNRMEPVEDPRIWGLPDDVRRSMIYPDIRQARV